jgi:hypothetical protein
VGRELKPPLVGSFECFFNNFLKNLPNERLFLEKREELIQKNLQE